MKEGKEPLSRLIKILPSEVPLVNGGGQITFANAQADKSLGLVRSDMSVHRYNDPAWKMTNLDGGPFPEEAPPFVRVMQTGQSVFSVEHAIEHPDGQRVQLSINAAPLRDAAGQLA